MKNRIIAIVLSIAIVFGLCPGFASAASGTVEGALGEVGIFNGGYKMNYLSMYGSPKSQSYTYFNYTSPTGEVKEIPAYCINPTTKGVPQSVGEGESIKYIANEASNDPKIVGIISNGYPHRGLDELKLDNKYQAYYATKMALWCYLIDGWSIDGLSVNATLSGDEKTRGEKILAAARDIYQRGICWTNVPQPTIVVTADRDSAYAVTIDGKNYQQQIFTAQSETWVRDYDISVGFTLPDEVPAGTRIVNMDNQDITAIRTTDTGSGYAGQFKVLYPADAVAGQSGAVQLSLHANVYKYAIYYALCAETAKYGTLQRYMCDTDPTTEMRQSTFSRYTATPSTPGEPTAPTETALLIKKVETGTNTPLPGALFEVKAPDGTVLGSFASDSSGSVLLPLTLSGQYVVTEKSAPKWHLLGTEPTQTVSVSYGNTATLTFENAPFGSLRVSKIDGESGAHLTGAEIEIRHVESGASYTGTTDLGGSVCFDRLRPGAYQIRELTAPAGWVRDEQTRTVSVIAGTESSFTLENRAKPGLIITKYDEETKTPLSGVSFAVSRDTLPVGSFSTDELGQIRLTDLKPGTYLVKEVAGDAAHVPDSTPQEIELAAGDGIKSLLFFNSLKPGIRISKVDSRTMQPLPNAVFRVTLVGGSFERDYITDQNGEIDLTSLMPGAYSVEESAAPDGYLNGSSPRVVQVNAGERARFVFTNAKKPTLTIEKLDSVTKGPVGGAKFRILHADSGSFTGGISELGSFTTDEKGQIQLSDLQDGWYRVTETEPAAGYAIGEPAAQDCFIQAGGAQVLRFENTPLSALVIKKVDADSGAALQGAKFRLRFLGGTSGSGGTVIGEYTTGANGSVVVTGLQAGTYIVEETKAPAGYELDETPRTVYLSGKKQDVVTVEFADGKHGGLIVCKIDSVSGKPLPGAQFKITTSSGANADSYGGTVSSNGFYTTDANGQIRLVDLRPDTYVVTETKAPDGYVLSAAAQTVKVNRSDTQTLTFANTPLGGGQLVKVDAESGARIPGVQFEIAKMNGERIGNFTTDAGGVITLPRLTDGWYTATEIKAARGYLLDATPHSFEVKNGVTTSLTVENVKAGSILIHKIDSVTGRGIYGVTFLVSDGSGNPLDQYISDQNGYVYVDKSLTDGKYLVREIEAADGYLLDTTVRTFYVQYGATSTITWKNTPQMGQIQITKKSADDNPVNGLPEGTLLPGAAFEIRDRAGNLADTVVSGDNGVAVTKTLPLGRYTIRETRAPANYSPSAQSFDAEIEFSGQIVRLEVLDRSVYTNVSVTKCGYTQVAPGQTARYDFKRIANNSTVSLGSFYWRDTLPADAVRLQKIITGTWNQRLSYKIVYKTNLHDYQTLADNLSTFQNRVLDCSEAALGLAGNEYVTEYMFVFGTVKPGFSQADAPYILCRVNSWLPNGYAFTNRTDVGGVWNGQWIQANDRWVTTVYGVTVPQLPKTGY